MHAQPPRDKDALERLYFTLSHAGRYEEANLAHSAALLRLAAHCAEMLAELTSDADGAPGWERRAADDADEAAYRRLQAHPPPTSAEAAALRLHVALRARRRSGENDQGMP